MIHALALTRGELIGRDVPRDRPNEYVEVPSTYRKSGGIACLAFHPEVTANCLSLPASDGDARAITYTSRYFPAYYLLTGFAANWYPAGATQIYLMRFVSLAVIAALLASCAVSLSAVPTPFGGLGVLAAVTPTALFMAASVNGSGIEIAAATGMWLHGALLATRRRTEFDGALVRRMLVAIAILCLTRPLSPGWSIVALVSLAWLAGKERLCELSRLPGVLRWAALAAGAFLLQSGWVIWQRPLSYQFGPPTAGTTATLARFGVGQAYALTRQMIGVFGWLDTPAPTATILIYLAIVGALIGFLLLTGPGRAAIVVAAAIAATILIPIGAEVATAHQHGFIWQGRYTLPIAVAIPIIAGVFAGAEERIRAGVTRTGLTFALFLVLAQGLAFTQALRRYSVGLSGRLWFFDVARWAPPVPSLLLIVVFLGSLTATAIWLFGFQRGVTSSE